MDLAGPQWHSAHVDLLVTGATGFLGRWVTRALIRARHTVRVLVRRVENLGDLEDPRVVVMQGDILSRSALQKAMSGVTAVVHCAGCVSMSLRDRDLVYRTNVLGTRNILETAAPRKIRVLHTSSISCI